tara:strand:+ start:608 stop:757 length:150 start_codon:yes stop_codon:yes gene_type:complete
MSKKTINSAWDIRKEGKLNKNNIIFRDNTYKRLVNEMKKVNDKLKKEIK